MGRLLLLTLVLIAYGSLYPWHFRSAPPGLGPFDVLAQSWPRHLDAAAVRDIAANVLLYLPVGLFAVLAFRGSWGAVLALLLGCSLSSVFEFTQVFVVGRSSSLMDITSDTIGTALGASAGLLWRKTLHAPVQRPDSFLLVCCWILAQGFPFLPHVTHFGSVGRGQLTDAFLSLAGAAGLVCIIDSFEFSPRSRTTIIAALLALVPLKFLIFTRNVSLLDIAAVALVFAASCMMRFGPAPAAIMLALAIAVRGVAPFHFVSPPQPFSWLPFQASLQLEWAPALTILLGKVFVYGALVWSLREAGMRLAIAVVATAVLLALIEAIQVYLPRHSAEITDPVLAMLLGWVFWSLPPVKMAPLRDQNGAFHSTRIVGS